ncbi:MAG TPA: hypothetical protein VKZ44_06065 [Taishania sp.]|nr:hypothetical protein [Taishania sp.]
MDHHVELKFQKLKGLLEEQFGEGMDVSSILFLIGVNELGIGYEKFSKNQKTDLMHIAICTLLEPYGYYEFIGRDEDNWPHFKLLQNLPPLDNRQQQHLLKEGMIEYFIQNEYYTEQQLEVD